MKRKTSASSIPVIKNALRPFFNQEIKKTGFRKSVIRKGPPFQTIRASVQPSDYNALFDLIEQKSYYKFPGLGNTFPSDKLTIPDPGLAKLEPLTLRRELGLHVARVNYYSNKIVEALNDFAQLNDAALTEDWKKAETLAKDFSKAHGLSIALAKKELLISFQVYGIVGLSRQYKQMTSGTDRKVWGLICSFIHDMVDPAYHPANATKLWLVGLNKHKPEESTWYASVMAWNIFGSTHTDKYLSRQILSYNAVSLIDLLLFLWELLSVYPENEAINSAIGRLDPAILNVLSTRFAGGQIPIPSRYKDNSGSVSDVTLFRLSYLYSELSSVSQWKSQVTDLLFGDTGIRNAPLALGSSPLRDIAKDSLEVATDKAGRLIGWTESALLRTPESGIDFTESLIAAEQIRLSINSESPSQNLEVTIAESRDVHDYIAESDLIKLSEREAINERLLLIFLLRDLAFKRQRTPDNDLERRASFMDAFIEYGREGLVGRLDQLADLNIELPKYIVNCCSRVFLEKLYLMMSSVKDVIETRILLCEWYERRCGSDNEAINEELRSLERELINLDARSDLDSTRVHVDEESLREWFRDTQYGRTARYTQTVVAEGESTSSESFLSFYNRLIEGPANSELSEDILLDTQIGSQFVLLQIVEDTLRAFVSEKSFGMDAYLSRRIRHGTLSGFLITPVSRIIQKMNKEYPGKDSANPLKFVIDVIEGWRTFVLAKIDFARRELIQIKSSDHPDGLIDPTWRVLSSVTYLDAMIAQVRPIVLAKHGNYDIFPDVHALCWDMVERDLAKVRLYLLREFSREVSEDLAARFDSLSYGQKNVAYPYIYDALQSLQKRVQEVCGWFIRPLVRRDSYDLRSLVSSTTSIVRELDVTYDFTDRIEILGETKINRGTFEVLADVLFVLVGNAAKHGKPGGEVRITADSVVGNEKSLLLSVRSEVDTPENFDIAIERLVEALNFDGSADLEIAAVREGFSGIRKILGLLDAIKADGQRLWFRKNRNELSLTFDVELPSTILFKQERA